MNTPHSSKISSRLFWLQDGKKGYLGRVLLTANFLAFRCQFRHSSFCLFILYIRYPVLQRTGGKATAGVTRRVTGGSVRWKCRPGPGNQLLSKSPVSELLLDSEARGRPRASSDTLSYASTYSIHSAKGLSSPSLLLPPPSPRRRQV